MSTTKKKKHGQVFLQSSNHTYLHSADPIIHPNLLLQSCRHQLAKRTENNSVAGQMTDGYNEDRQWNGRWFRVSVFPITYTNRRQAVPLCILLEVLIKPHVFRSMRTKNPMSSTEFTNRWQKKTWRSQTVTDLTYRSGTKLGTYSRDCLVCV